jgi:hypothetical protein
MNHDRFTHHSPFHRVARNLALGLRNPSLLVHNLIYKTPRAFRLLSLLLVWTSLSNGCYLSFEVCFLLSVFFILYYVTILFLANHSYFVLNCSVSIDHISLLGRFLPQHCGHCVRPESVS